MIGDEQPKLTDQHGDAGLRWLLERREGWGLTHSELASLLGVSIERLLGWKEQVASSELLRLPPDVLERVGLLLGLHRGLFYLTPSGHESLAAEWFKKPIAMWGLKNSSIRAHLLDDPSIEALSDMVRKIRSASV
ncbi:hypothetical protein SAMN04487962_1016 [Marinobacter segnicrescens]|uniref:Antitoxin Xre/MbcA/ParS-like toxin-binding domain-containing protein n=1 Tax=Marinobacter segnicrescens TaxID=430453 RepID=A0A1H9Y7N2_9GAMM|nr:hypothetical protein [Marinobacter segnicrescens]SES64796.1 hypothetical protein SAMN04487962_1016 [Marinobacter segnicrescens]